MMKRKICLSLCIFFLSPVCISSQIIDTVGNTSVRVDSLIAFSNVYENMPWDLHWGPDQTLWYTVGAKICRYDTATGIIHTIYNRQNVSGSNSMSIATHPDFTAHPVVYATYDTTGTYYAGGNRIVLFKYDYSVAGDSLYNETEILSWDHPGEHSGGRIYIGQDQYLYVTTSEYWPNTDSNDLSGKILRVGLDGSVPAINPPGAGYAISYGHRNPQGIVMVPVGHIMVGELGQQIDELNLIRTTGYYNYGWPAYDGDFCIGILPDSCTSPSFVYESPIDTAIRPMSGIDFYNHTAIPEFEGCILQSILSFGGIQGGIVASRLNAGMNDVDSDVHYFKGKYGRVRDVCVSPDGKVFAITNDRSVPVIRVIYNPEYHIGIEEENIFSFNIYPNPAMSIITLQAEKNIGAWEIISLDGKTVMNGNHPSSLVQLNIESLLPGIYFFKIKTGIRKFVKG